MSEEERRPDPEALLRKIQQKEKEEESGRGKLKIILGAAAGVGKTYKMLKEGQLQKKQGQDGCRLVETHGRPGNRALLEGLEIIPRRRVEYGGIVLEELDLDAVLARHPAVALVDELAHTNAPVLSATSRPGCGGTAGSGHQCLHDSEHPAH
jgi:two-component system sensor histidine kinase KdpD